MGINKGSFKALLLVCTVFALGIALGATSTYVVTSRVQAARPQGQVHSTGNAVAAMTRDLNLTPDQQKQIETILNDTQGGYAAVRKQEDPLYEQVRQEGRQRIRQVLTAEQGPKFEDILRRIDDERRKHQAEGQQH